MSKQVLFMLSRLSDLYDTTVLVMCSTAGHVFTWSHGVFSMRISDSAMRLP